MKIDPRTKLFLIVALTTLSILAKDAVYLSIVFLVTLIVNFALKTNIFEMLKRTRHFFVLLVIVALVQSLTVKGGVALIKINEVVLLSTRGLQLSGEFFLRMAIIVFAGGIATTCKTGEMLAGFQALNIPYKFVFMTNISLRFLPIFKDEFSNRINALAIRGIEIKKLSFSKKIKTYSFLISPTVSSTILKSKELARSMLSKGFGANKKRTILKSLKMSWLDWLCISIFSAGFVAYLTCMYIFGGIL